MSTYTKQPARLGSEDVIINAPMSYAGSAQRIAAAAPGQQRREPGRHHDGGDRAHRVRVGAGHGVSGRLTAEEFEERVSTAQKARTRADLDVARVHLPHRSR